MRAKYLPFEPPLPDLYYPQGDVLEDLGALRYLDPVLLSEELGIEKPAAGIWTRALKVAGMMSSHEALHVGDDLKAWVHSLFRTSDRVKIDFRTLVTTLGRRKLD